MTKRRSAPTVQEIEDLIKRLSYSRKYRELNIPEATLTNLVNEAAKNGQDLAVIDKTVRLKLHNLAALYLGDPDYQTLINRFSAAEYEIGNDDLQGICLEILKSHASTAERIPFLSEFYQKIFETTGTPDTILDLACGLNPFAIPWMQLPARTRYYAYDLHQPRVQAIGSFFHAIRQPGAAIHRDILVDPPQEPADIAFFFKEAHRFEQRKKGCNRDFFASLPVKHLLVSLPTSNLTGRREMLEQDHLLMDQATRGFGWQITEILFENEIVFCIRKDT